MKAINFYFIIAFLFVIQLNAQHLNTEITENTKTPYLLGKIDRSGLENGNYAWFAKNYENYTVDQKLISSLSDKIKDYELTLFMGTWCGDSKREVPKIYKILDQLKFPENQLTTVAVGRTGALYKKSPQHEEEGLNIHRVPTLIFYKNGKVINRIVEEPVISFEQDILDIVSDNNYAPNYAIVTAIHNILNKNGIRGLEKKTDKLLTSFKSEVSSMYELNTYGKVLTGNGKTDEAIAVFRFNTKLFPDEPRVYMSLANTIGAFGEKDEALKVIEEAKDRFPKNKDILKTFETIATN